MKTNQFFGLCNMLLIVFTLIVTYSCMYTAQADSRPEEPTTDSSLLSSNKTESPDIVALHEKIFVPSCAVSGCHDGHFEPDFRTVQSSFSTLVYHPIIKNNIAEEFTYRVVPFDASCSVLYERISNCCFVNKDDRMPQLIIGKALPDENMEMIREWIDNGARDIYGKIPKQPNDLDCQL